MKERREATSARRATAARARAPMSVRLRSRRDEGVPPACGQRYPRVVVDNPFERYDLDPREGIAAVTARLKELAEDADGDAERERIRDAWEELTLHPARRLRAALFACPETRSPLGAPPPMARPRPARGAALEFEDIAARPSVVVSLGAAFAAADDGSLAPSLDDDPLLPGRA